MPKENIVAGHYTSGGLLSGIEAGVLAMGKTTDTITIDDLGPVDEFHIGGREASMSFLDQLGINSDDQVLDVGCGLGGASRFVADRYGSHVSGIDLTPEFIETGKALCGWVGLGQLVSLEVGSATALSYSEAQFDKAFMMHVGMNIADKAGLATNVYRVLKPGGLFGIYDVMQTGDGELSFPVPWATTAEGSAVDSPSVYRQALEAAGFEIVAERNRRDFAIDFFQQLIAKTTAAGGPPPLGLHIVMGEDRQEKMKNVMDNIKADRIAPVELIARKN